MNWNPTIVGLTLDMIGFLLVFVFGGFEVGRSALLLEEDNSHKMKPLKVIGGIMVIAGFRLQIYGAL